MLPNEVEFDHKRHVWMFRGFEIEPTRNGAFRITYEGEWLQPDRSSVSAAVEYIKKQTTVQRRTVELAVLDQQGNGYTLTGFHTASGEPTFKGGSPSRYSPGGLYADTPAAHEAILALKEARETAKKREEELDHFRLLLPRFGTRDVEANNDAVDQLPDRYETARKGETVRPSSLTRNDWE